MDGGNKDIPLNSAENDLDNKQLKETWERQISGLTLYHGTSERNAEKIMQEGFNPNIKPYSVDDKKFIEGQLQLRGTEPSGQGKGRDTVYFAQEGTSDTTMYALSGPEIIRLDFYPATVDLINRMNGEKEEGEGEGVDPALYDRVVGIKQKLLEDIYGHRPVLIKIKRESESFRRIIKERLVEELWEVTDNYEVFKNVYQGIVDNYGLTPEKARRFLVRVVRENLQDMSLDLRILPEELELISGKDFDGLDNRTREYADIRDFVFNGEKRQPSELLFALHGVINYPNNNSLKGVLNVCRYYEISEDDGKKLYDRAMEYQKMVQIR